MMSYLLCCTVLIIYAIAGRIKFCANLLYFVLDIVICALFLTLGLIWSELGYYQSKIIFTQVNIKSLADTIITYAQIQYIPYITSILIIFLYIAAYLINNKLFKNLKIIRILNTISLFIHFCCYTVLFLANSLAYFLEINILETSINATLLEIEIDIIISLIYVIVGTVISYMWFFALINSSWKIKVLLNKLTDTINKNHKLYYFYGLILGIIMLLSLLAFIVLSLLFNKFFSEFDAKAIIRFF